MWQFVTIERGKQAPTAKSLAARLPASIGEPTPIGTITHALTHRRYEFQVFIGNAGRAEAMLSDRPRKWVPLDQLSQFPLPRPHLKVAEMLRTRFAARRP